MGFVVVYYISYIVYHFIVRIATMYLISTFADENAINKSNKGKSLVTLIFLSQSEVKKP